MTVRLVCFLCANSAAADPSLLAPLIASLDADVRVSRLPCTGMVDVLHIVRAVDDGADAVVVAGCPEGACTTLDGNLRARLRVAYAGKVLVEAGLPPGRVRMVTTAPGDLSPLASALREMTGEVRAAAGAAPAA